MTSISVEEDSLDLCAHYENRQHGKGQTSQAGPLLYPVDPPIEEVCWFLLEGLLGQVRLIFVDLVIAGSCQGFGRGSSVQGCTLA